MSCVCAEIVANLCYLCAEVFVDLVQNRIVIGLKADEDKQGQAHEREIAEKHMMAAYKRAHAGAGVGNNR